MLITFSGASDDLVHAFSENGKIREEWNAPDKSTYVIGGKLRVIAMYGENSATWCFAPEMIEEGFEHPTDWKITTELTSDMNGYTTELHIDTGADEVRVFRENG